LGTRGMGSLGVILSALFCSTVVGSEVRHADLDVDDMKDFLAKQFMQAQDDFAVQEPNSEYFPLAKAELMSKANARPNIDQSYADRKNETESWVLKYRGFFLESQAERDRLVADFMATLSSQNVADRPEITSWNTALQDELTLPALWILPTAWRYLEADHVHRGVVSNPKDWSQLVNLQPVMLQKAAQNFRSQRLDKKIKDEAEELFARDLKLAELYRPEIGFILAYRWKIQDVTKLLGDIEFSMTNLVKLPVDAVLTINQIYFDKMDLAEKLKEAGPFSDLSQGEMNAWYSLAQRYLGEKLEDFDSYKHLWRGAPIDKIRTLVENLSESQKIELLTDYNFDPIKVQEIWNSIYKDAQSDEAISSLFFKIGHKLDINQFDTFYQNEFAHVYSKRHELEAFWVGGTVKDVPWSHIKYVSNKHHPTKESVNDWIVTDVLNLGKFSVSLKLRDLQEIPSNSLESTTVELITSDSMTNGQLCILYNRMMSSRPDSPIPEALYPCLSVDILAQKGGKLVQGVNPITEDGAKKLIAVSHRLNPAQLYAVMPSLKRYMFRDDVLRQVVLDNPTPLHYLSNDEFVAQLKPLRDAIVSVGWQNWEKVQANIRRLPGRLLSAWLEATVPVTETGMLDVDVLLDRPDSLRGHSTLSTSVAVDLNSPSSTNALMHRMALIGLTCDLIEKIPTGEIVDVISALRYQTALDDSVIKSDVRKCLVRKLRDYLSLKSELYGVKVGAEIELLSLLSTADIRAVGPQLLLTWGGEVLTKITHPQVMREVLQITASYAPHIYFHNGVDLAGLKTMADTYYKILLQDNTNVVDITVLKKMRDFLPYLDTVVDATRDDIKLFFTTVLEADPQSRGICTPLKNRNLLRNMIIKGFGSPDTWSSLDLVTIGDYLIVMTEPDLYKVPVESMVRALPELVEQSVYSTLLPEVRGRVEPQLYYEACAAWLNDGKPITSGEGKAFMTAWRKLASWHLSGADLVNQKNNVLATLSRKKRDETEKVVDEVADDLADDFDQLVVELEQKPEIDYRVLHTKVMDELMKRFKDLTKPVANEAVKVISDTQELLGNGSLTVMDIDPTSRYYSQQEVLELIKTSREDGRLSDEQEDKINKLALDSQVRLIQKLVALLNLNPVDLGISAENIQHINSLETFTGVEEFMATATYQPYTEKITEAVKDDPSKDKKDDSNTGLDNVDVVLVDDAAKEKELQDILSQYGPEPLNLSPPASIPRLADITLTCDDLISARASAAVITAEDVGKMAATEVYNCVEYLGGLDYSSAQRPALWSAIKDKLRRSQVSGIEMAMLGNFLSEAAKADPAFLDLSDDNLGAISVLGRHTTRLVQDYLDYNAKGSLSREEVVALGRMVCGLKADEWKDVVHRDVLLDVLVPYVSDLDCEVDEKVLESLRDLLSANLTVPNTGSVMAQTNWFLPVLSLQHIKPSLMMQMSGPALRNVPDLGKLRTDQLSHLAPHAASLLLPDQFTVDFDKNQGAALLSSVGEDPRKVFEVERRLKQLASQQAEDQKLRDDAAAEPEPEGGDDDDRDGRADGGVVNVSASARCLILCILLYTVL